MSAPQTNGVLRATLESMNIGDYIACEYSQPATVFGGFTSKFLGNSKNIYSELDVLPRSVGYSSGGFNGNFYFIKVDSGLLIADRIVVKDLSAQTLNTKNYLLGAKMSDNCIIRCLSKEEFLKYISNSDLNGNIIKADYNVWHGQTGTGSNSTSLVFGSRCIEINQNRVGSNIKTSFYMDGSTYNSTNHAFMGGSAFISILFGYTAQNVSLSNGINSQTQYLGFRPALEYIDNAKSTNLYY